ncbi:MAG: hypothetical protein R3B13_32035 [Polyangiaceae bacterium]
MRLSRSLLTLAAFVVPLSTQSWARADAKECAGAYEKSQELKGQSKLRAAREQLLVCAQAACPDFIKRDCGKWLGEVDSQLPTVVFSAKANGEELSDVRVLIDDEVVAESLDGRSLPMDPGAQTFTFESEAHGSKEVRFVVKEGQKAQSVVADFGGKSSGGSDTGSGGSVSTDDADDKTLAYVFTGVGAVGIGAFAFFALTGKSDENGLACADTKTCTDDDIDPIKQKYLFADIGLGVGVVSLGLATYFFLKPSSGDSKPDAAAEDSARMTFDVLPTRGGGFASVSGQF